MYGSGEKADCEAMFIRCEPAVMYGMQILQIAAMAVQWHMILVFSSSVEKSVEGAKRPAPALFMSQLIFMADVPPSSESLDVRML